MQRRSFGFAGGVAALLVVVMVAIALRYDLPIRDPRDLAGPSYIRLPLILLLALVLDVVPRAVSRSRASVTGLGRASVAVVRERWGRAQVAFALSGITVWYVSYVAFRNLKSYVPFVNGSLWDDAVARVDRFLWFGNDPAVVLQDVFGTGWAAQLFSLVYLLWIALIPGTLAVCLVWTRRTGIASWYVSAVVVDWALGAATYYALPTLGPAFSSPENFTTLPVTPVSELQRSMISDRAEMLANPFGTDVLQSIAAFASLHVAVMVTICLIAHLVGAPRWQQMCGWGFLALTEIATVYLGWHFFLDTLAGAAIGVAAVWIAALGTGHRLRGPTRGRSSSVGEWRMSHQR